MRSKTAQRIADETPEATRARVREYYDAIVALGKCRTCGTVRILKTRVPVEDVDKFLERNAYL